MSIESEADLEGLRAAGRVVARAIAAMRARVRPGISTGELDRVGARVFAEAGARSGPRLAYDFPGVNCISVNDEAVHGIPGPRRLREGDLVKLDVTAELDGYYADACVTVPVGSVPASRMRLISAGRSALDPGRHPRRALRAHDRHHRRGADHPHRLSARCGSRAVPCGTAGGCWEGSPA